MAEKSYDFGQPAITEPPSEPINLILFGPPGIGKIYQTALEAVRRCNGTAPDDRDDLKRRYRRLEASKRIAFVTFHQSCAYEDFVEGLRPVARDSRADYRARPRIPVRRAG